MSFPSVIVLVGLAATGDPYVRTRADGSGSTDDHCLFWQAETDVVFRQNDQGNADTTGDTEFAGVSKSFASWQAVLAECASISLSEGVRTPLKVAGYEDGSPNNVNVTIFRPSSCTTTVPRADACWNSGECHNVHDCWDQAAATIALTTTTFDKNTGRIYDSDIEFNAAKFLFTTVDSPPCVAPNFSQQCVATDVQNTATHELGHVLGLDHTAAIGSTMNTSAPAGETSKRQIDPGSRTGICGIYPAGQPSQDCVPVAPENKQDPPRGLCSLAPGTIVALLVLGGLPWARKGRGRRVRC